MAATWLFEMAEGLTSEPAFCRGARKDPRYPAAMSTPPVSAQDLHAAAETYRELGPEYRDAVLDSFLEKVEARIDARMNARLAELVPPRGRPLARLTAYGRHNLRSKIAIAVGAIGVPLGLTAYNATLFWQAHARDLWAAVLVASAGSCGAGVARMFGNRGGGARSSQASATKSAEDGR